MIISLSGEIGTGKDTVAKIIELDARHYTKRAIINILESKEKVEFLCFEHKKFADNLKKVTCLILGCTLEQLEDREFKETPLGEEWDKFRVIKNDLNIYPISQTVFCTREEAENKLRGLKLSFPTFDMKVETLQMTPREFMQLLGTDFGRKMIHPDIWCNATLQGCEEGRNYIISDARFLNENVALEKKGAKQYRILNQDIRNATLANPDSHQSELEIDLFKNYTGTIENTKTDFGALIDAVYKIHNLC